MKRLSEWEDKAEEYIHPIVIDECRYGNCMPKKIQKTVFKNNTICVIVFTKEEKG